MCSDTSTPRISFSNDLPEIDKPQMQIPRRRDTSLLDSNSDFEFIISHNTNFEQKSSSADELFAYGMILPVQGRKKSNHSATSQIKRNCDNPLPPSSHLPRHTKIENCTKIEDSSTIDDVEKQASNKSFWKFKRSSSLKCDVANNEKSIISSFPVLSRSQSTGSAAQKPKKVLPMAAARSSSLSHSSCTTTATMQKQKPPLLKKNGGGYGNGMKINPVLNMHPPPYISRLGFGFFLPNGSKDKKSKN